MYNEEKAPNFLWSEDNLILMVKAGSHAYGTNHSESDKDKRGVVIPPLEYHLGLKSFSTYTNTSRDRKATKDDVDINLSSLHKFMLDGVANKSYVLETLFVRDEDVIFETPLGNELRKHKDIFLTKGLKRVFGGIARSNTRLLEYNKGNVETIQKYTYDTKACLQAVRSLLTAKKMLSGDFKSIYLEEEERALLRGILNGDLTKQEALTFIYSLDEELETVFEHSSLPESVDSERVNQLTIQMHRKFLSI